MVTTITTTMVTTTMTMTIPTRYKRCRGTMIYSDSDSPLNGDSEYIHYMGRSHTLFYTTVTTTTTTTTTTTMTMVTMTTTTRYKRCRMAMIYSDYCSPLNGDSKYK